MSARGRAAIVGGVASAARRIVVGYDGSEAARRALEHAADLAGYGSTLTVVNVADPPNGHTYIRVPRPEAAEDCERLLNEARSILGRRQLVARYVATTGEPAEELIEAAHSTDADLIVVGKRNHNPLQRLVLGSVSTKVVHQARCDVLVVA
jgi:nucleotide-binding universal stress UspA family protein